MDDEELAKRMSEYIDVLPATIPEGKWLVHNHVRPDPELGLDGFRAWLADPDPEKYLLCSCDWASHLGWHYSVRKVADRS